MVPDDPCQVVRILGCPVGEHAGGGELCDDHSEFAVLLLRLTAQHPNAFSANNPNLCISMPCACPNTFRESMACQRFCSAPGCRPAPPARARRPPSRPPDREWPKSRGCRDNDAGYCAGRFSRPDEVTNLHRRASCWYDTNEHRPWRSGHALIDGDVEQPARVLKSGDKWPVSAPNWVRVRSFGLSS